MICWWKTLATVCAFAVFIGGCGVASGPGKNPPGVVDLGAEIAHAGEAKRPLVVLVGELGTNGADRTAAALLENRASNSHGDVMQFLKIDLGNSRNRSTAARFHLVQTPVLVCFSPMGVIVSRDQGPITAETLGKRLDDLPTRAADIDAQFASLLDALNTSKQYLASRRDLAKFLLAHQNDREAIPYHLAELAGSDLAEPTDRANAWVSHCPRPPVDRRTGKGPAPKRKRSSQRSDQATPDAIAGGNLVLGTQDATAKRFPLAPARISGGYRKRRPHQTTQERRPKIWLNFHRKANKCRVSHPSSPLQSSLQF